MTVLIRPEEVGEWLSSVRAKGLATIIALHQERWKKAANPLKQWPADRADADEIEAEAVESLIERRVTKKQMFLCAYREAGDKPCDQVNVSYSVEASELIADDGQPSHAALYRAAVDGQRSMLEAVLKTNALLHDTCRTLSEGRQASEKAHAEALIQLTEISSLRLEREQTAAETTLSRERMAELARQISPVMQAILAKWMGLAPGHGPLVEMVKSLNPEQLQALQNILTAEQWALLAVLFQTAEESEAGKSEVAKEEAKKKGAANGHV